MNLRTATLSAAVIACSSSPIAADIPSRRPPSVIFREISRYSVRVRRDMGTSGAGSGTVLESDHGVLILTCAHVVGNDPAVLVDIDAEGKEIITIPAIVEKVDEFLDLAALRVIGGEIRVPKARVSSVEPDLYDELYTVGSPVTVMRQAHILRLNTKDTAYPGARGHYLWSVSGAVIPGMSGSGVFNSRGEVVAVVKSCLNLVLPNLPPQLLTSEGFVIAVSDIRNFLRGL